MKNIVIAFLILCILVLNGYGYALDGKNENGTRYITQVQQNSIMNSQTCSGKNKVGTMYLDQDNNKDNRPDTKYVFRDNFVIQGGSYNTYLITVNDSSSNFKGSEVSYYIPEDNMLMVKKNGQYSLLKNSLGFWRASNVSPKDKWVRALESKEMLISAPSNINHNKIQISFIVRYAPFQSYNDSKQGKYGFYEVVNSGDMNLKVLNKDYWIITSKGDNKKGPVWNSNYIKTGTPKDTTSIKWGNEYTHDPECFTYTLEWCGDGKIQNGGSYIVGTASEQCDLGSANGTDKTFTENGKTYKCSATCQKIEQEPKCKSLADGYNEMTLEEYNNYVSENSSTLDEKFCKVGKESNLTVQDNKVTWKCNNQSSVDCTLNLVTCNSDYNEEEVNRDTFPQDNSLCNYGQLVTDSFTDDGNGKLSWKCGTYHSKYVEGDKTYNRWSHMVQCSATYTLPDPKCKPEKDIPQKIKDYINQGNDLNNRGRSQGGLDTSDFCKAGGPSNFTNDTSNHKWTWKCQNGDKESNTCELPYTYCGDGEVNGDEDCDPENSAWKNRSDGKTCTDTCTIVEPENPTYTIQKKTQKTEYKNNIWYVDWEITVTGTNAQNKTVTVTDALPNGFTYVSHTNENKVTKKEDSSNTKPQFTVTLNEKGSQTFTLVSKTDYLPSYIQWNKVCIGDECQPSTCTTSSCNECTDGRCSEDKHGYLTITKTSNINEVKNIGDEVVWTIKVTAHDKPVLQFVVEDVLPEELEYVSAEGTNFTISTEGNKVTALYNRLLSNPLEAGKTATFTITSKLVKWDEKKTIKNVACILAAKKNDNTSLCAEKEVTVKPDHTSTIDKTVVKSYYNIEEAKWYVDWKVTAKAKNMTEVKVKENFPSGYSYVTHSNTTAKKEVTKTSDNEFTVPLVNGEAVFTITTSTSSLSGSDTNEVCLEDKKQICDPDTPGYLTIQKVADKTKKITQTDQEVNWNIVITANHADIENFVIEDQFSDALSLEDVKIIKGGEDKSLEKSELKDGKIFFTIKGTLENNSSMTISVKTKVKNINADKIPNKACILSMEDACSWDEIIPEPQASPWIEKVFLVNGNEQKELKGLHKGDKVEYKITFGNTGDKIAKVKFEDFQPANLGERKITSATDRNGNSVDLNKTIELKKDEMITVLAEGVVTKYNYKSDSDRTNTGKITKLNDDGSIPSDCKKDECYFEDRVRYTVDMKPYFWIEKGILVNGVLYTGTAAQNLDFKGGDHITFQVRFGNSGEVDAENVKFDDPAKVLKYLKSDSIKGTLTVNGETKDGTTFDDFTLYEGVGHEGLFILEGEFVPDNKDGTKASAREFARNQACVGLKDQWDVKDPFKAACANVGFKPHFPSLKITKTVNKSEVESGDIVNFTITVTNNGDSPISGLEVIDVLPEGMEYMGSDRTNGFPQGDLVPEDQNPIDTVSFLQGNSIINKPTNFSGSIALDTLKFSASESFEVESITLYSEGISPDKIEKVTLGGKEIKNNGSNAFTFDFRQEQNGAQCNDVFVKDRALNLEVTLKEGGNENEVFFFRLGEVKGSKSFANGIESRKVKFIRERAEFSGEDKEVRITVPSVIVDTLTFELASSYDVTQFYLRKTGSLSGENIKAIKVGGKLLNISNLSELNPGPFSNLTNGSGLQIEVELSGMIPGGATLGFELLTLSGNREIEGPKNNIGTVTFVETDEDKELVKFVEGVEKKEEVDVLTTKKKIDTLNFQINWDLPSTTISLENRGSLPVENIEKILIGNKPATFADGKYTVTDISIAKATPTLDVEVVFTGDIEKDKDLQFALVDLKNGRNIITGTASKTFVFKEIPEYATFAGGETSTAASNSGTITLDSLTFQVNNPLTLKSVALSQTGSLSGNIAKIALSGVEMSFKDDVWTVQFAERTINSGDTLNLEITFKGEANSGDTLGFKLEELNERRHIATGSETKLLYFEDNPESVQFVALNNSTEEDDNDVIASTVDKINIDTLSFNLNKDLRLSNIALEKGGNLETGDISEVRLGNEELKWNSDTNRYEWNGGTNYLSMKNTDTLALLVKFNKTLPNNRTLSFKLVNLKEGRHIATGSVTKNITFSDNPAFTKNVELGGTMNDGTFTGKNLEVKVDVLKPVFRNFGIGTNEKISLTKLILTNSGTLKNDQISSLSVKFNGGATYSTTGKNGVFTFDFKDTIPTLDKDSTIEVTANVKEPQKGNTLRFNITDYEIEEKGIGREKGKTRVLSYETSRISLMAEHATGTIAVRDLSNKIFVDNIIPNVSDGSSATINQIVLTLTGDMPLNNIQKVTLAGIEGTHTDTTPIKYTFINKDNKLNVAKVSNKPFPLEVTLQGNPENNKELAFILDSFEIQETDTMITGLNEPLETNMLVFNDPVLKVNVQDKFATLDQKTASFGVVHLQANGFVADERKIDSIKLELTGDVSIEQVTGIVLHIGDFDIKNYTQEGSSITFSFPSSTVNPMDFTIKATLTGDKLDGKTLGFVVNDITMKNEKGEDNIITIIDNDTTDLVTYYKPKVTIAGSDGAITTKDKTVTLDELKIATVNVDKPLLKSITLTLSGNIIPDGVKLYNTGALVKDKTYKFEFNKEPLSNGTSFPLVVTLPDNLANDSKLQFIIENIELDDENHDIETGIEQKNTNTLTFNDPFVTIKGFEGEQEIQGQDFVLSGFTVGYNGAQDINLTELTLILSGIDVTHIDTTEDNDIDRLRIQYDEQTINGVNEKGTNKFKFAFKEFEGNVTNPGGIVFMVKGKLQNLTALADGSKFNFIITGVKANIDEEEIKVQYDPIDHSQTGVYKKHIITINVKNLEDGTFKTLDKPLQIDFISFDGLKDGQDYSLINLSLIPQGTLSGAIAGVKIAGTIDLVKKDGKYVLSNNAIKFTKGASIPITVTFDPKKVNNGDSLSFEVVENDFGVSPAATYEFKPEDKKTRTITFSNPIITLEGAGKGTPEKKTKNSEVELGNLTFTLNGLENNETMISEIILTLSGKNFKPENLTAMKLTTPAGDLQMNGKFEKNKLHFTAKDTEGITIKTDQKFVVKVTLTGDIVDDAELFFEVTDFNVVKPDSSSLTKESLGTTTSIIFSNPMITLKGLNHSTDKINESFRANVMTVSSKEIDKPILKSIILSRSGDIQSGNIESISLAGFTGEYQTDDTYSFSFGDNGLEITKDMPLFLDVTFTGEDLTGKKIGFPIKEAQGNEGVKIKIEQKETETITHASAGSNACYQGVLSDGYFKAIDTTTAPQIRWYDFQGVLQAQHSITLSLKAKVTQSGTNKAMATNGDITTDWAEASVRVKTKEPLSCNISPNTVNVNFHNYSSKDVKVTCSTDAGKKANIQIDCGNGTKSSVIRSTFSSSMTCTYKESDFTKDSNGYFEPIIPKCTITYDSETVDCQGSVAGTGDGIGFCGDGAATDWEDCDCISEYNGTTKVCNGSNVVFNEDRGIKERDYKGGTCRNCKLENTEITPVPCWDVNAGSISIQQGEILPFYWNVSKVNGAHYTVKDGGKSAYKYNERGDDEKSCNPEDEGKILLNSMLCTFKIYNGKKTEEGNPIYAFTVPCFNTDGSRLEESDVPALAKESLFAGWANWLNNNNIVYGNDGGSSIEGFDDGTSYKFAPGISYIKNFGNGLKKSQFPKSDLVEDISVHSGNPIQYYGEYKLSLDEVSYIACVGGKWQKMAPYPRVCQNNFAVTTGYIVTKTPSGIGSSIKKLLEKFYFMNGDTFADSITNLVEEEDFDSSAFETQYTTFKNKNQKLAIKASSDDGVIESKVPGKDIFFVSGNMVISGYTIAYDISKSEGTMEKHKTITTPVTIVQTSGDTTIKGNIDHNIMLLSEGEIIFDGTGNCDDAQTVNGIFYAKDGFKREHVHFNTDIDNSDRCIGGGLHIKGALIGSGIEELRNRSRSQLNTWFYGTQRDNVKQRREGIFNGAAVLIEYSPTVSAAGSMPPGAEDFTSTLSIYKR